MLVLGDASLHAASEFVFVAKILSNDDHGIIVRSNGDAYQIEKGVGCLSFWRYEGKQALIVSPGMFLGVGSKLVLPDDSQECRIWDSKELGQWQPATPKTRRPSTGRGPQSSSNCIDGHWVQSVTNDGQLLVLEDRSVWEVDPVDAIHTMLWLPTQNVLVCGNRIINSNDGKAVRAVRLK
jgi:hypothetical protein